MRYTLEAQNEQRRKWILWGAGAAVVGGWACASAPYVPPEPIGKPEMVELIYGIGLLDASLSSSLNTKDVVALLGTRHTLLFTYNGKHLLDEAVKASEEFRFEPDSQRLFIEGTTFWGNIFLGPRKWYLEVAGLVLPPIDTGKYTSARKSAVLVFRGPPASARAPNLQTIERGLQTPLIASRGEQGTPSKLGGFNTYRLTASH